MIGAGPDVFAVWGYVIANTVGSQVELNPVLLAMLIGTPEEAIVGAIDYLCAPDANSRSKVEDGRRLVREGEFAYRVPNHETYRSVKNEDERREYNRVKQAEHRAKKPPVKAPVNDSQTMSAMSAHTEAEAAAETKAGKDTDSGESDLRASRLAALPKPVCDSLHSRWSKLFGGVDYGRFRKAVLPIFSVPPEQRPTPEEAGEAITTAWEFWIEQEDREQAFFTLNKFVEQFGKWKTLGGMPLVDRRGDITERGNWAGSKSLRQQERDRRGR